MNSSMGMDPTFAVPLYVFPNALVLVVFTIAYIVARRMRQSLVIWLMIAGWWMLAGFFFVPVGLRLHPAIVTFIFSNPIVAYAVASIMIAVSVFDASVNCTPSRVKAMTVLSVVIAVTVFVAFVIAEMYFSTTVAVSSLLVGG